MSRAPFFPKGAHQDHLPQPHTKPAALMDDAAPSLIGCQALEQFVLLSKSARGPAVPELIKQALAAPGVYVFGELLEADSVRELAGGANANYLQLLEIFAYGTYSDYKGTGICGHHNLQSRYECFFLILSLSLCVWQHVHMHGTK